MNPLNNGHIYFENDEISFSLHSKTILRQWIEQTIKHHNKKLGSLTYVFCSSDKITEVNTAYLEHTYPTDIITFNYNEENLVCGEIYMCPAVIKENAIRFSSRHIDELHRVIIHGVLHLIGFNDHSGEEKTEMRAQEDAALSNLEHMFHVKHTK